MIDPTDLAECRALAHRAVGDHIDWTETDWNAQLIGDSVVRTVDGASQVFYRPYRSALLFLLRPTVAARTEGDVSEQYRDTAALAAQLREWDVEWAAQRLPPEARMEAEVFDSKITWGSW